MNALELRKGNIIQDSKGRYLQVHEILEANLRAWHDLDETINQYPFNSPDKDDFSYEECSGVDLTPEILVKCGFENELITYWIEYSINGTVFYIVLGHYKGDVFKHLPTGQIDIQGVEVKSLHQLQNLIYTITGIYLEINM